MGKRSGRLDHEADFLTRGVEVLDRELARCRMMRRILPGAGHRKSLDSRIHWLEKLRTRHPDVDGD